MKHLNRTISLNGIWQYQPGGPAQPAQWSHALPVPGLVDLAEPACEWQSHDYHWHRTTFTIAKEHLSEFHRVAIEQAMFGTAVWVNGCIVGSDIACYTTIEFDISEFVHEGENELVVRVGMRDTLPPHSAVGRDQEREAF